MDELDGSELTLEAKIQSECNSKKKPPVDKNTGQVHNTPLQQVLRLKVQSKVILTSNIDVMDSLTNGAFGEVVGFENSTNGVVKKVLVEFIEPRCGEILRQKFPYLGKKYPGRLVTPISPIEFPCRSSSSVASGMVYQFPLRLAFASTSHKVSINLNHFIINILI